jgi:hypothetical protein
VTVAGVATHFSITAPANTTAGSAFSVTVTALDANNNKATGYTGTVHFTSSDAAAVLPADYTFTSADAGVHTFTNAFTLKTAGSDTVTATDKTTSSITGSATVSVTTSTNVAGSGTAYRWFGMSSSTANTNKTAAPGLNDNNLSADVTLTGGGNDVANAYEAAGVIWSTAQTLNQVTFTNGSFNATSFDGVFDNNFGLQTTTDGATWTNVTGWSLSPAYSYDVAAAAGVTYTFTGPAVSVLGVRVVGEVHSLSGNDSWFDNATEVQAFAATATASSLVVSGYASPTTAGVSNSFTVTARDASGNTVTGYTGTITFSSSDAQAGLPASYTFVSGDAGQHTFAAIFKTSGTQSLTAKDTVTSSISGSQSGIIVNPAAAGSFQVSGFPASITAGVSQNFTVTAKDVYGNIATGYTGTVSFSSSDAKAILPANYTFTSADAGSHVFSATMKTAASQSLTAKDSVTSSISGSQSGITVNPAAASQLQVSGFPSTTAGIAQNFTIKAQDPYGNTATSYTGTVSFSSTDPKAILPANYTFTSADAGSHVFAATMETAASQSLTAKDSVTSSISGSQSGITVNPAAASQLQVSGFPSTTAGIAQSFTIKAQDPYGNMATSYTGNVSFSSTDPKAILPANYTFTSADAGSHVFSATLKVAASQSLTSKDTLSSSITGSQSGIVVSPAAANHLIISRYALTTTAGTSQTFKVTVQDLYGNTITGYTGTTTFSSTDAQAILPTNYTFTSADAGMHTFSATLKTVGSRSLTAKDAANAGIAAATSVGITVNPAATSQLLITGFPLSLLPGGSGNFTVTAKDAFGNTTPAYTGTLKFTSSDLVAVLPANYTFTSTDAGVHIFNATLKTPGVQSISATDTVNAAITGTQTGINVVSVQPTAGISGPSSGVPGQPLTFTLSAVESGLPASTVYSFSVQWGDGSPVQTLSGLSGLQVNHAFLNAGVSTINLTVTDPSGNPSAPAPLAVTLSPVLTETDPYNSTLTAVFVGGTTGADTIAITPVAANGIQVAMNFVNYGSFYPTGHVIAYGQGGDDIIKTAAVTINGVLTYVTVPAIFFGGDGNDTLNGMGSSANNVLVGGAGANLLVGGQGRDVLIGGSGTSTLRAGSGGDILIGGTTSFDNNATALAAVLAEWSRTDADYATRIAHLTTGGGLNGSVLLNSTTVQNNGLADSLSGGAGLDWFFAGVLDVLVNKATGENVTSI